MSELGRERKDVRAMKRYTPGLARYATYWEGIKFWRPQTLFTNSFGSSFEARIQHTRYFVEKKWEKLAGVLFVTHWERHSLLCYPFSNTYFTLISIFFRITISIRSSIKNDYGPCATLKPPFTSQSSKGPMRPSVNIPDGIKRNHRSNYGL